MSPSLDVSQTSLILAWNSHCKLAWILLMFTILHFLSVCFCQEILAQRTAQGSKETSAVYFISTKSQFLEELRKHFFLVYTDQETTERRGEKLESKFSV